MQHFFEKRPGLHVLLFVNSILCIPCFSELIIEERYHHPHHHTKEIYIEPAPVVEEKVTVEQPTPVVEEKVKVN